MKAIEKALYARLTGDATLMALATGGVWRGVAPVGTNGVIVVFAHAAENDFYALSNRAVSESSYLVKAVAPGETATPAWDAANRIDVLLNDYAMTLDTGTVLSIRRERVTSFTELDGGEQYQHAGGYYLIWTQG